MEFYFLDSNPLGNINTFKLYALNIVHGGACLLG